MFLPVDPATDGANRTLIKIKCRFCGEREAGHDGLCTQCRQILLSTVDASKLPILYRLVLKIPFITRIEGASGVFWGLIVPVLAFFNIMLTWFMLMAFPFPINIILVGIVPTSIFIVSIRLSLERFINFWNYRVARSHLTWDIEASVREYLTLLKKKEAENT